MSNRVLEGLQKSLIEMDIDELLEVVRSIRTDRRIRKDPPRQKKATSVKKKDKLRALLSSMSPEERAAFIGKL